MASPSLVVLSMILALHSILSMACASLPSVLQCESEVNLHLYLHQIAFGQGTNQVAIVLSSQPAVFGLTTVIDWTVIDGPNPNSTIVARTKGMQVQADVAGPGWFNYFSMVFEKNSRSLIHILDYGFRFLSYIACSIRY